VLVVLFLASLTVVGWYYADEVQRVETPADPEFGIEVVDVTEDAVTLARNGGVDRAGAWGLAGPDWYARVGAVIDSDERTVTRTYEPAPDRPLRGDSARIDGYAYPADPKGVFDFEVEEVVVAGPLGDYLAYYVPGERSTWVVFVHGRGAHRGEGFRLLPTVTERGHPALLVSYRNDAEAPPTPDGRYGLGWTEWEDVAAAVDWAVDHGAQDVVLVGYSMGGALVGNYVRLRADPPVRGLILDAPVTDWGEVLRTAARARGVPTALTPLAQAAITARSGVRWEHLRYMSQVDDLDVPILLFHGEEDETVPVATSDELAEARPDLVSYVRVPGARHVQAWNVDRETYESSVTEFLERVAP
jgi:uncharacterized protein